MKKRWVQVAALAAVLFAINVIARLIARLAFNADETLDNWVTTVMFAVIGVVLAGVAFIRAQRSKPSDWLPDLTLGALGGMLLTILVGPFISGGTPFAAGAGNFFSQVWIYAGFAIIGTLLGYWLATTLGRDYRSRTLTALAQQRTTRPRRPIRR